MFLRPLRPLSRFRQQSTYRNIPRVMGIRSLAPRPVQVPERMEIRLTETEDQLCTLLDEGAKWMEETKGLKTSCRIAGGWVRDKLLGSDSNDIDIALEGVMGVPFAEHFVEFIASVKNLPIKSVSKVESNPDQSKHLETAKTTVLDTELDFVNLRSEEYAEGSRIPTEVTFGTPLQDALRRDSTINALFYNVHTRSVEDHTEKGLDDLRNQTIRTPLEPKETFRDDPLRVIRCIRFASRFGFSLVPELRESASDPEIQAALTRKISRERVGEELYKMLKGRDPLGSIHLINDLGLYDQIFHVLPSAAATLSSEPGDTQTSLAAAAVLASLLSPAVAQRAEIALLPVHPLLRDAAGPALPRLFLAAALTPYKGLTYADAKGKTFPATETILRDGLKLGAQNHYFDGVPALFAAASLLKAPDATRSRVKIGLLLREKSVHNPNTGQNWALSLLFSLVQELTPLWDASRDVFDGEQAAPIVERYNTFVTRVEELDLIAAIDAKPLLDGREVVRILEAPKPGPWTGMVLARVIEWQLEHPAGSKEECAEWLKAERAAGRIVVEDAGAPATKRGKGGAGESAAKKAKR